jgi:outer membrane immunogenic protein
MRSVFRGIILSLAISSVAPASAEPRWPSIGQPSNAIGDWTGVYMGLNGGFGFAHATASGTIAGFNASASQDLSGAIGGGQIGFNWQTGATVLGIEADIQASGVSKDTLLCPASFCGTDVSLTNKVPWFATFRGRVGFVVERFLVYATGGLAYAQLSSTASMPVGGVTVDLASWSDTRAAWTVGGGVEFQVSRNWSTKLEYLYMDTGNFQGSVVVPGVGTLNPTLHVTEQIIRAGLNYRF